MEGIRLGEKQELVIFTLMLLFLTTVEYSISMWSFFSKNFKYGSRFDLNGSGPDNLFGYTSLGYDYYGGYSHAQARDFDSSIGRFISEDTYEGDIDNLLSQNLYTYVENNPLRYVDPSGNIAMAAGGLYLIPGVGEVLAVVTGAGIVVYGGYKIYQWATAPEEAPNVSIPKKIELKVIPGGNNTNKPDPNPKPKAPPVNQPNNYKQRKEPTKFIG